MSTPIDMLGIPKAPKSAGASMVRVGVSSANGSTGVRVKVFDSVFENIGNAITYKRDAIFGDTFKVNIPGVYAVSYTGNSASSDAFGITVDADPTLAVDMQPNGVTRSISYTTAADTPVPCAWTGYLNSNAIVRAHQGGATSGSLTGTNIFSICLVTPA